MTQTRWVVLKIEIGDGDAEQAKLVDGTIEQYIRRELDWLNDSFTSVEVLEISDEYDGSIGVDGE